MTAQSRVFFSEYLTAQGGETNQARTPDSYGIRDPNHTLEIQQFVVSYQFLGKGEMDEYGNIGLPLTNGIELKVLTRDGVTVKVDLTSGIPLKTNGDWWRALGSPSANQDGQVRVISHTWRVPVVDGLVLEPGESAVMVVGDDLSLLQWQYGVVQGLLF